MYDFNQKPDLNITPLVDIMLVLLAILMVTAPVMDYEEPISLPKGSKSKQADEFTKIEILITKDKIVKLNKRSIELNNFPDTFTLFSNNKDQKTPIHIKADKELIYDDIMMVLRTVKEAGFYKISLITDG
ncbi:MAG: biopolymer transporter ExbD [Campylobacterota bacterium]